MQYSIKEIEDGVPVLKFYDFELLSKDIIGDGGEATVYEHIDTFDNIMAMKIFDSMSLSRIKKIQLLSKLKDESFVFPKGIVISKDTEYIQGYYMNRVTQGYILKDLDDLTFYRDLKLKLKIIKEADEAIKRAHNLGLILGDIHAGNILIDQNNKPKFVDTDNYKYKNHDFDLIPDRFNCLYNLYGKDYSDVDNDKFTFGILVLSILFETKPLSLWCTEEDILDRLNFIEDNQTREGFRQLLSDSFDKPYIGEIIDEKTFCLK